MKRRAIGLFCLLALVSACWRGSVSSTATPNSPAATATVRPALTDTFTPPPPATVTPSLTPSPTPAISQVITFQAEDGVTLTGEVFPAVGVSGPAPAILLMHQMGSRRSVWVEKGLVAWLTHRQTGQRGGGHTWFTPRMDAPRMDAPRMDAPLFQAPNWPPLPPDRAFTVFTFDFRGHGDSQGRIGDTADFLMDAKAALVTLQGLPNVDPQNIATLGASIGADAAIDVCVEGCKGALSLSPGSYLDVPYAELVSEMAAEAKPAWCAASQGDALPAQTCQDASGATYRAVIYPGTAHGSDLLIPGRQPDMAQIVLDFLKITFGF